MSDISKCDAKIDGKLCPKREYCQRYIAEKGEHQSWISGEDCASKEFGLYWPVVGQVTSVLGG